MILFLFLGIAVMLAPFFSRELKRSAAVTRIVATLFITAIGSLFTYIGGSAVYEDYLRELPPVDVQLYSNETFQSYNMIEDSSEQSIDVKNEVSKNVCDEDECWEVKKQYLFTAADADKNGKTTLTELKTFVATFDKDNNGVLSNRSSGLSRLFKDQPKSEFEFLNLVCPSVYGKRFRK
jgi:hypothetical protein